MNTETETPPIESEIPPIESETPSIETPPVETETHLTPVEIETPHRRLVDFLMLERQIDCFLHQPSPAPAAPAPAPETEPTPTNALTKKFDRLADHFISTGLLLIAMAVTCLVTIPGGVNDKGHVVLGHAKGFRMFMIANSLAILFSVFAVGLAFLSDSFLSLKRVLVISSGFLLACTAVSEVYVVLDMTTAMMEGAIPASVLHTVKSITCVLLVWIILIFSFKVFVALPAATGTTTTPLTQSCLKATSFVS